MLIIATISPFTKALPPGASNASLLLTQDAVIAVTNSALFDNNTTATIYALESDLVARGLLERAQKLTLVNIVNLSEFVKLTTSHHPIMNW